MVQLINQAQSEQKRDIVEFVEEKFERRLSAEISRLEGKLSGKIADCEVRLSEKIAALDARLSEKIMASDAKTSSIKAELIKWMFIFWVGQVAVFAGIMFAFFKR